MPDALSAPLPSPEPGRFPVPTGRGPGAVALALSLGPVALYAAETEPFALRADARDSSALVAESAGGLGADLAGGRAPLRLRPAASPGAPGGAHCMGELYVDALGDLYLCVAAGTPGTWRRVVLE